MTLSDVGEAEVVNAQLAFHLHAGVDVVVVERSSAANVAGVLDDYAREGFVHLVPQPMADLSISERRAGMARFAAAELGADWVINCAGGEFWWPRGGSLGGLVAAVPPRYGIVRALPRVFVRQPDGGSFFAERLTIRRSTTALVASRGDAPEARLGAVHRAGPGVVVGSDEDLAETAFVPLRGWYPIEVFRFPSAFPSEVKVGSDDISEPGLEDGSLVVDTRLRDVLRVLRLKDGAQSRPWRFALPSEPSVVAFPRATVVDDAAYAVEVAAFGGVGEAAMGQRLDEAENRIATLELSVWARLRWKLRRLARDA